jgi:hypothetical protein
MAKIWAVLMDALMAVQSGEGLVLVMVDVLAWSSEIMTESLMV